MSGCIVCFSERHAFMRHQEVSRFNYPEEVEATYYCCAGCGLISKEPKPSGEELQRSYSGAAWQFSEPRPKVCWDSAASWILANSKRLSWKLNGLARDIGSKGSDLGEAMKRRNVSSLKWECVDPHPVSDHVVQGWVGTGLPAAHDCVFVSATHVLEHASEPRLFLQDMLGMLREDGLAYIEVPSLEGHSTDAGSSDDLTRDHLWHFTTESLIRLALSCEARIVAYELEHVPGWPVHRLLLSRSAVSGPGLTVRSRDLIRAEYDYAADMLSHEALEGTGLYAASHSYAYLMRERAGSVWRFPIFDAYKTGKTFGGKVIYHPDRFEAFGVKRVFVTTRFWNAYQDIKRWLEEKYPALEVRSPFRRMQKL